MTSTVLSGKKRICVFCGRSWQTVKRWIMEEGFPARKIDGIWETDSDLVIEWRRGKILGVGNIAPLENRSIAKD